MKSVLRVVFLCVFAVVLATSLFFVGIKNYGESKKVMEPVGVSNEELKIVSDLANESDIIIRGKITGIKYKGNREMPDLTGPVIIYNVEITDSIKDTVNVPGIIQLGTPDMQYAPDLNTIYTRIKPGDEYVLFLNKNKAFDNEFKLPNELGLYRVEDNKENLEQLKTGGAFKYKELKSYILSLKNRKD